MTQEYTPVEWVDETENQVGTVINKARLDQMQTAHHFADGFREVDAVPTADPGVNYHMVVYCTVDKQFYRWTGSAWEKDIDDDTKALLLAHEADHSNPHAVTKAQVGLGNVDNTSDMNKPVSTAQQAALDRKIDDVRADGQSVVENRIADIPPADDEVVGVAMTGFDGYIESPYWRHFTTTIDYVGLYVPYEYDREQVDLTNKDSLGIIPGTTPAFLVTPNTYPVKQTPPRWDEFYGYTEFDVVEAYMGFFVEYNGQMVKVVEENKDSLGIVPGTTKAYNRAGGLYAEITVDQLVGYDSENPVSSKAVTIALQGFVTVGTAQTITGIKTFNYEMKMENPFPYTTGDHYTPAVKFNAGNNKITGQIAAISGNNINGIFLQIADPVTNTYTDNLTLYADGSHRWAQAPTRPYASYNVSDVVTIGSLASNPNVVHTTGNEIINGTKTFVSGVNTGNFTNVHEFDGGDNKTAILQSFNGSNDTQLLLRMYNDGTAKLELMKTVNGVTTITTIATL